MKLWSYCMVVLGTLSCKSPKQLPAAVHETNISSKTTFKEEIVFINFKITSDSITNQNQVDVINTVFSQGHLKTNGGGMIRSAATLTCFLYENNRLVDSVQLEHPLYRVYEYMNEKNEMTLKETREKQAEFFARFQIKDTRNNVKVVETINNITKELLFFSLKKQ